MPWEKNYDETEVLARAMEAFWAHGYEATSMSDLVAATGINRGSIYAAFKDKHTLFVRVLKHYDKRHRCDFLTYLQQTYAPRDAILAMFEAVVTSTANGENRTGCLLVNTALELSAHDPEIEEIVRDSLVEVERFFQTMIEAGQADGSIRQSLDPAQMAQALLAQFLGLRVLSRSRPDEALLAGISKQAVALLD